MKVKCKDNSGRGIELTINKIYYVLSKSDDMVYIINNLGRKYGYMSFRFSLIKEKNTVKEFEISKFCKKMYDK